MVAVMYSKLGGCLGVDCKVGPFSQNRPLSWCQGFVGKVNDQLRVRFFFRRTLGMPSRGAVELLPSREVVWTSWEAWGGLCLGGCLLPCTKIICWIIILTCLGVRGVRRSPVFRWRQESSRVGGKGVNDLGKTGIFPGRDRGSASLGRSAAFPSLAAGM